MVRFYAKLVYIKKLMKFIYFKDNSFLLEGWLLPLSFV